MSDHSPEPWVQYACEVFESDSNEELVAPVADCDSSSNGIPEKTKLANARRIVACVNACKGVSTTSLIRASRGEVLVVLGRSDSVAKALREGKDQQIVACPGPAERLPDHDDS